MLIDKSIERQKFRQKTVRKCSDSEVTTDSERS